MVFFGWCQNHGFLGIYWSSSSIDDEWHFSYMIKCCDFVLSWQVGLYMKIEPLLDSSGVMINVSKTLLCNDHKPPGARPFQPMIDNSIDNDGRPPAPPKDKSRSRGQAGRRYKDRKNAAAADEMDQAACSVPVITPERSEIIGIWMKFQSWVFTLFERSYFIDDMFC